MVKYQDLVNYTKEHHINWNTDLFDVLKGFFEEYSPQATPSDPPIQQELVFSDVMKEMMFEIPHEEFQEPEDGEYSTEDLLNLFST